MPAATTVAGPVLVIARSADASDARRHRRGVVGRVRVGGRAGHRRRVRQRACLRRRGHHHRDRRGGGAGGEQRARAGRRHVPDVGAGPAGPGRGHERHPGRQGVRHRHVRRVRRAAVDDHQRVRHRPAGRHRRRPQLRDRQIGRGGHGGRDGVLVVRQDRVERRRRNGRIVGQGRRLAGRGHGDRDHRRRGTGGEAGRRTGHRDVADVRAGPAGAARGHEHHAGRQGVRHGQAGRVRGPEVVDRQLVRDRACRPRRSPGRSWRSPGRPTPSPP